MCVFGMYMSGCADCVEGRRRAWDTHTHVCLVVAMRSLAHGAA